MEDIKCPGCKEPMNVSVTSCVDWWRQMVKYLSTINEPDEEKRETLDGYIKYLKQMLANKENYC